MRKSPKKLLNIAFYRISADPFTGLISNQFWKELGKIYELCDVLPLYSFKRKFIKFSRHICYKSDTLDFTKFHFTGNNIKLI